MATHLEDRRTTTPPPAGRSRPDVGDVWPRLVGIVIGAYLFVSAFLWPHSPASRTNTWIVGLLITGTAVWGLWFAAARFFNTALAMWLALSTLIIVHVTEATIWNNLLVAAAVFIVSLIPSRTPGMPHRRGRFAEV